MTVRGRGAYGDKRQQLGGRQPTPAPPPLPPPCRSAVAERCLGKPACSVAANQAVFGEPCKGLTKALTFQFRCGPKPAPGAAAPAPRPKPSPKPPPKPLPKTPPKPSPRLPPPSSQPSKPREPSGPAPQAGDAQYSRLWGAAGERWSPASRLADHSYAGCAALRCAASCLRGAPEGGAATALRHTMLPPLTPIMHAPSRGTRGGTSGPTPTTHPPAHPPAGTWPTRPPSQTTQPASTRATLERWATAWRTTAQPFRRGRAQAGGQGGARLGEGWMGLSGPGSSCTGAVMVMVPAGLPSGRSRTAHPTPAATPAGRAGRCGQGGGGVLHDPVHALAALHRERLAFGLMNEAYAAAVRLLAWQPSTGPPASPVPRSTPAQRSRLHNCPDLAQ